MMRLALGAAAAALVLCTSVPGSAQDSCLSVTPPSLTLRTAEGCRFQAGVLNACGRPVRYIVVRALPHPTRGMLPPQPATVERFALAPLTFERELCEQRIRLIELGDGVSRDVTEVAMTPAVAHADLEGRAARIGACVAQCPAAQVDRAGITAELRGTYRHAVDDANAVSPLRTMIDAIVTERQRRERVCADVCHGRIGAAEAPGALRGIEAERSRVAASAMTALAAIAARPPRNIAPDPPPPPPQADDEAEQRPTAAGNRRPRVRAVQVCRRVGRGQRCSMVIQRGVASAPATTRRSARGARTQARPAARQVRTQRRQRRAEMPMIETWAGWRAPAIVTLVAG